MSEPSTDQRAAEGVKCPPSAPLPHDELFVAGEHCEEDGGQLIELDRLREWFHNEGRLSQEDALLIVHRATEIFRKEPTLLEVVTPVTIVGDLHGQFYDLERVLNIGGSLDDTNYLFLGNYINRGGFSIETVLLLYALKIACPDSVFLLRGKHECRLQMKHFDAHSEIVAKYGPELYEAVAESFCTLPLAAVVNNQFLCVHGGISPEISTLEDISSIDRFREPPSFGPMCDILWSDPAPDYVPFGGEHFGFNEARGCSYVYTFHAVAELLEKNQLLSLVRGGQAHGTGYNMMKVREETGFPSVISIFSAPNFLDVYGNKGAVLHYNAVELNIRQFNQMPHPFVLPMFTNAISWSLPFVTEKIAQILQALLQMGINEDLSEEGTAGKTKNDGSVTKEELEAINMRNKDRIKSLSVTISQLVEIRDIAEGNWGLESRNKDDDAGKNLLLGWTLARKRKIQGFDTAAKTDAPNLKRPPVERKNRRRMSQSTKP